MNVQAIVAASPKTVIWSFDEDAHHRPIKAEADQADLAAVCVPRQREIRFALRQMAEGTWVVQEHDSEVTGDSRMLGAHSREVLLPLAPHEIHAQDLYRARRG